MSLTEVPHHPPPPKPVGVLCLSNLTACLAHRSHSYWYPNISFAMRKPQSSTMRITVSFLLSLVQVTRASIGTDIEEHYCLNVSAISTPTGITTEYTGFTYYNMECYNTFLHTYVFSLKYPFKHFPSQLPCKGGNF
jgi:hypothetical protein